MDNHNSRDRSLLMAEWDARGEEIERLHAAIVKLLARVEAVLSLTCAELDSPDTEPAYTFWLQLRTAADEAKAVALAPAPRRMKGRTNEVSDVR